MTLAAVRRAVFLHGQEAATLGLLLEQLRGVPPGEWIDWAVRFERDLSEAGHERSPARGEGGLPGQMREEGRD